MSRIGIRFAQLLALIATPAAAASPSLAPVQPDHTIMQPTDREAGWSQLSYARDGDCEAEVRGNGKFFRIYVVGLSARESARLHLTNGIIKPIDWLVRAAGDGTWSTLYIPFTVPTPYGERRERGEVLVRFVSEECSLNLAFPWYRGIRVID